MSQAELFEPRADECGDLARQHLRKAAEFTRAADVFSARGWHVLAADHRSLARRHEDEAECLAEYAHLLRLAKVSG